jgi:hypothetical protein
MKPPLAAKQIRAMLFGAVFGLTSALAWALPRDDNVCMIDPADEDAYISCLSVLSGSFCCWFFGL